MRKTDILPRGLRFYLPEEVEKKQLLETTARTILNKEGYEEIITPLVSYVHPYTHGKEEGASFTFSDRSTGKMLQLRSDVTPEIAAAAASIMKDRPRPLKLQYHTNIFRQLSKQSPPSYQEVFQSGIEVIGCDNLNTDVEVIELALRIFKTLKIPSFHLSLSSVAFFRKLIALTGLQEEQKEDLKEAILKKDLSSLALIAREIPNKALREGVIQLPKLIGKEEVFTRLRQIEGFSVLHEETKALETVYNTLAEKGYREYILIDIAEIWGYDYYTDIIFECFIPGFGYPVASGGRYNKLLEHFGTDEPAVGFALNNSLLISLL